MTIQIVAMNWENTCIITTKQQKNNRKYGKKCKLERKIVINETYILKMSLLMTFRDECEMIP